MVDGVFDAGETARLATDERFERWSFSILLTGVATLGAASLGGLEELARLTGPWSSETGEGLAFDGAGATTTGMIGITGTTTGVTDGRIGLD